MLAALDTAGPAAPPRSAPPARVGSAGKEGFSGALGAARAREAAPPARREPEPRAAVREAPERDAPPRAEAPRPSEERDASPPSRDEAPSVSSQERTEAEHKASETEEAERAEESSDPEEAGASATKEDTKPAATPSQEAAATGRAGEPAPGIPKPAGEAAAGPVTAFVAGMTNNGAAAAAELSVAKTDDGKTPNSAPSQAAATPADVGTAKTSAEPGAPASHAPDTQRATKEADATGPARKGEAEGSAVPQALPGGSFEHAAEHAGHARDNAPAEQHPSSGTLPATGTFQLQPDASMPALTPSAAPSAMAAARPPPPPSPVMQVAPVAIALSFSPEAQPRIAVVLEPAELGRVEITIDRTGERAAVQVIADRPDTLALLQRDHAELDRALESAGISPEGGRSLSFSLSDGGNAGGDEREQGRRTAGRAGGFALRGATETGPARAARGLLDIAI